MWNKIVMLKNIPGTDICYILRLNAYFLYYWQYIFPSKIVNGISRNYAESDYLKTLNLKRFVEYASTATLKFI